MTAGDLAVVAALAALGVLLGLVIAHTTSVVLWTLAALLAVVVVGGGAVAIHDSIAAALGRLDPQPRRARRRRA